jgi:tRNA G18 (ribose-2'-O)-methylase SpoU
MFLSAEIVKALAPHMSGVRLARLRTALRFRLADTALVFENVANEHNVSACLRTADAFGVQDVHLIESYIGATFSSTKGVDRGASKWISVHRHRSSVECLSTLRRDGFTVFATDLGAGALSMEDAVRVSLGGEKSTPLNTAQGDINAAAAATAAVDDARDLECDRAALKKSYAAQLSNSQSSCERLDEALTLFSGGRDAEPIGQLPSERLRAVTRPRVAIVFGNEHRGCSKALLTRADVRFFIPQAGFVQSMNLSVAAALATSAFCHRTADAASISSLAYAILQSKEHASIPPLGALQKLRGCSGIGDDASYTQGAALPPPTLISELLSYEARAAILARWLINDIAGADAILGRKGLRPIDL